MISFKNLTTDQREDIFQNKTTTELLVDRVSLNFENIENELSGTNIEQDFELPPVIVDEKHMVQILAFAPPNNKGRWIRTYMRTYLEGGKVIFKKFDDDSFIAKLEFQRKE
ncbi:MAG: hypothetical protein IH946_11940 [Bacteroidetes bacterium]|nr:hypothetical protein [Bacteroidota bacterium]